MLPPLLPTRPVTPFRSFWWAGYECTDQLNAFGHRVDLLLHTGHLACLEADYLDLAAFGIRTVREGIRWSRVEARPYRYDWSVLRQMLQKGRALGIQQSWDLCHFGYPDDLTPLHPLFARRFAALCQAFVETYREIAPDGPLVVTPINEVSFISWLGGDVRGTSPYAVGQGWEVKYALMRAYIEGVAALREADPSVQILTTEPLVHITHHAEASPDEMAQADLAHYNQYQATDILTGRICPELGGKPEYLDFLGVNFYYNNQWVLHPHRIIGWADCPPDPRWRPLQSLLHEAHHRYNCPVVLSETSHPGIDRPRWIAYVADECAAALRAGVPLLGVCLYPIVDRPDWDFPENWHHAGLWDTTLPVQDPPLRVLDLPYADALRAVQRRLEGVLLAEFQQGIV